MRTQRREAGEQDREAGSGGRSAGTSGESRPARASRRHRQALTSFCADHHQSAAIFRQSASSRGGANGDSAPRSSARSCDGSSAIMAKAGRRWRGQRGDRGVGLGEVVARHVVRAGARPASRPSLTVPAKISCSWTPLAAKIDHGRKSRPRRGVVAEGAEVADQRVRDAEVAGGIAGLDRLAAVEDHRGELVEHRDGLAGIALEGREVGHRVVVEVEAAGGDQPEQRRRSAGGTLRWRRAARRRAGSGGPRRGRRPGARRPTTGGGFRPAPARETRSRIAATSALKA